MTKKQAIQDFKLSVLPYVVNTYGKADKPAIREAWNNYTDSLCKNGLITDKQYHSWIGPY